MEHCANSKRHNKFLLPVLAKAIYGIFGKTESEISNIVNYSKDYGGLLCNTGILTT